MTYVSRSGLCSQEIFIKPLGFILRVSTDFIKSSESSASYFCMAIYLSMMFFLYKASTNTSSRAFFLNCSSGSAKLVNLKSFYCLSPSDACLIASF
jgi:hypothetical protein